MFDRIFHPIVCRVVEKMTDMMNSSGGWLLGCIASVLCFFGPVKYAFIAMGVAIAGDLLFGIISAIKRKKYVLSQLMRDTPAKVIVYVGSMVVVYVAERIFSDELAIFTRSGCAIACACELWSMLGSALIICPNLLFPRILKLQLKGEIENKLGKNVTTILEKEDQKNDKQDTPRNQE